MLTHLQIHNHTIIETLSLDFSSGFTVITGQTGAGKSILLDCIHFALGARAEPSSLIHPDANYSSVTLVFQITAQPTAQDWLQELQPKATPDTACTIQRILRRNGRSQYTINDQKSTQQQVRDLARLLIHLDTQNAQYALLQSTQQRHMLDAFGQHSSNAEAVAATYQAWKKIDTLLQRANNGSQQDAAQALLAYQLSELESLELTQTTWETLEDQHRQQAHRAQIEAECTRALAHMSDEEHSLTTQLYHVQSILSRANACASSASFLNANDLLEQARINIEEAIQHVRSTLAQSEADPETLDHLEHRMRALHDIARKHRVTPEKLWEKQQELQAEYCKTEEQSQSKAQLEEERDNLQQRYQSQARTLTQQRETASARLDERITAHMQKLGMPQGKFQTLLIPTAQDTPQASGQEEVVFTVTTNPGQPLQPLAKVASGGERARLYLILRTQIQQQYQTPTMIFDEIDTGVSGEVAEMVGRQLRALGAHTQVIAITHLPQVAAQSEQHLYVEKHHHEKHTSVSITPLNTAGKTEELARLLSGREINAHTRAHAASLLADTE